MEPDRAHGIFDSAREDAAIADVAFVPYSDVPFNIPHAAFFAKGWRVSPRERAPLDRDARIAVSDDSRHRITCWLGLPDETLPATIRHELEHASQWERGGGNATFELVKLAYGVMDLLGYSPLPASGQIYNLIPAELGANGAASDYLRRQAGHERVDEYALSLDPGLRLRPLPEPYDTLALRSLCHLAVWPEATVRAAGGEASAVACFEAACDGGTSIWKAMLANHALEEHRMLVARVTPTSNSLASAPSLTDGWAECKAAIMRAVDCARDVAGLPPTPT